MEPQNLPPIAPELIQALISQATASGLTVNDYLSRLLGLTSGHEENGVQSPTPFELVEDVIGSEDSSLPEDPDSPPHRPPMYYLVAEKLRKQGLKTP